MAKAQKGDLIRIVKAVVPSCNPYKNGDILEVYERGENFWSDGVFALTGGDDLERIFVFDYEYEIHRKFGEEDGAVVPVKAALHSRERVLSKAEFDEMLSEGDVVNSPNHYTQGRFETIEIIEEITQGYSDGYVAYCVGNALKYLARAPFKHGEPTEDLAKAGAYINFALERLQTQK